MKLREYLPKGWRRLRFGDIARFRRDLFRVEPTETYRELSLRLYGNGFAIRREVSGSTLVAEEMQYLKEGQLVTSIHQFRNGAIGIIPLHLEGAILSKNFLTYDLDSSAVDGAFLHRFLTAPSSVSFFQANSTGSATPIFPKAMIEELEIPLPPLAEQRRVAARIEELAGPIEEAIGLRKNSIDLTVTLQSKMASKLFDALRCDTKALGEVAFKRTGVAYRADDFSESEGVPVVRLKEIETKQPTVFLRNPDAYANVWLEVGDIILAKTSFSTGAMCQWPGPAAVLNQNAVLLRAKHGVEQRFLFAWLEQQVSRYLSVHLADPNFYPYIRESDLVQWQVPVPAIVEQERLVAALDAVHVEMDALGRLQAETAAELDALLPAILDRAFKGELV